LHGNRNLPAWVRDYFLQTSDKITTLSYGEDFRSPEAPEIKPDQARDLVGEALDLWRPGAKNAFARLADDAAVSHAALDMEWVDRGKGERTVFYAKGGKAQEPPTQRDVIVSLKKARSIEDDRAKRLVRHGRKMNNLQKGDDGQN
jgi:hypothetical protein